MFRVIAGKYRSRKLHQVVSEKTRPTTDKNKESLFNSLGQFFEDGYMLDLFAGSGALGIEGLSRGMKHVTFVENNDVACKIISDNLNSLKVEPEEFDLFKNDVFSFLRNAKDKYDFIIADPPYALGRYQELLEIINSRQLINENGIIVLESSKTEELPEQVENLLRYKEKILGITKFSYYTLEEQK